MKMIPEKVPGGKKRAKVKITRRKAAPRSAPTTLSNQANMPGKGVGPMSAGYPGAKP